MSAKNDIYQPLYDIGLAGSELDKSKARIRATRQHGVGAMGLTEADALSRAIQAELNRDKTKLEIPKPPTGSGLSVAGSENPTGKEHSYHWSFTYYDISLPNKNGRMGKKRRIRFEEIPSDIVAKFPAGVEETIALKRRLEAESAGMKCHLERQAAWIEKNKEHKELRDGFLELREDKRKKSNRRSNKSHEKTALNVVYDFFLNEQTNHFLPDVKLWPLHFDEFRTYLNTKKPSRQFAKSLTLRNNTQKNYTAVLNKYVSYVWKKGKFAGLPPKCENYTRKELESRGAESLIEIKERDAWITYFHKLNLPIVADYITVACHIGARPSEALAISIADIKKGELPAASEHDTALMEAKEGVETFLKTNGHTIYGYIVIKGQISDKSRQADGSIILHPLKNKSTVDPAHYRYVPIIEEGVWTAVKRLISIQKAKIGKYGKTPANYLLFDDISLVQLEEYFRRFRIGTEWADKTHSPHCCRHTGCTYWAGIAKKKNLHIAMEILGHGSLVETMRYMHLVAKLHEEMIKAEMKMDGERYFEELIS